MKKLHYLLILISIVLFTSCEDVVQVDLATATPRLVIEGALQWQKGTTGNEQKIKLTTTTGFYSTTIPTVSNALVYVTDSDATTFTFTEEVPNSGLYLCHNFIPEIDKTYTLFVILNGETYTATETLKSVSPITAVDQNNNGGFSGNDIEIRTYYTDPDIVNNYYLFKFKSNTSTIPNYQATEDKFFQGNNNFELYLNDKVKTGDNLDITIYGVSKRYFEYMSKLILISGGSSGGPFSTTPATVHGNIINQSNPDNYALGYFSASETDFRNYVVQ